MKRNTKGHFGYIRRRKRNLSIMVGILAAGIIGLVLLGYLTLGTKNNWLTIVAILTVLPTANLAVVLFALLPYKGRPKEEYDQVVSIVGDGVLIPNLSSHPRQIRTWRLTMPTSTKKACSAIPSIKPWM